MGPLQAGPCVGALAHSPTATGPTPHPHGQSTHLVLVGALGYRPPVRGSAPTSRCPLTGVSVHGPIGHRLPSFSPGTLTGPRGRATQLGVLGQGVSGHPLPGVCGVALSALMSPYACGHPSRARSRVYWCGGPFVGCFEKVLRGNSFKKYFTPDRKLKALFFLLISSSVLSVFDGIMELKNRVHFRRPKSLLSPHTLGGKNNGKKIGWTKSTLQTELVQVCSIQG